MRFGDRLPVDLLMTRTLPKPSTHSRPFAAHFHLLGSVDFEDCLLVQRRLAYDALSRGDGRIAVLLCEHPRQVTIGRGGSRADVRLTGSELAARQVAVRYVGRGGGAVCHGPGQLAIYPVVPLDWHRWSVGQYLHRLQSVLVNTLRDVKLRPQTIDDSYSLAGRRGPVAVLGASVRHGVTGHGGFLNVNPDMRDQGCVAAHAGQPMSSILSERPLPVRMHEVRAALVAHLAAALGCDRHHLHTGHPLLAELPSSDLRESAA